MENYRNQENSERAGKTTESRSSSTERQTDEKRLHESAGNSMSPEEYSQYVKQVTPTNNTLMNMVRAFLVGGIICCIGQAITSGLTAAGIEKEAAGTWTSIILVGAAILLTGFNLFSPLVKFGGAGALVPITGFANSMVSPAIEYKKEGHVFGIGCKIFTIAGPVILYGVFTSWVLGVIYWVLMMLGVVS